MSVEPNSASKYFPPEHKVRSGGPSTARALNEMRKAILERVDVLQNFIEVANGKMPERWDAALNPRGPGETGTEAPIRLTIEHMMHASLVLLKRILPEYRQVDVSSADTSEPISYEEAREKILAAIASAVAARGGKMREDGTFELPPRSRDPSPATPVDAGTLQDGENGTAEPVPDA